MSEAIVATTSRSRQVEATADQVKTTSYRRTSKGNTPVPNNLSSVHKLTHCTRLVYEAILAYCWGKKTDCYPGVETLAVTAGVSEPTVKRAVKQLIERGFIRKVRRGQGKTNRYYLLPLPAPEALSDDSRSITATSLEGLPCTPTKTSSQSNKNPSSDSFEAAAPFSREDKEEFFEEPEEEGEQSHFPQSSQDGEAVNKEKSPGAPACSANAPQSPRKTRARGRGNRAGGGDKRQPRQPERERKPVPPALVDVMLEIADRDLNDVPRSMMSNVTKGTNLFYTLWALKPELNQEEAFNWTVDILCYMRDRVCVIEDGRIKYDRGMIDSRPNRAPLFWSMLEQALTENMAFTKEQLEHYRSKEAMYL